jgi:hypothetical protein
MSQCHTDAPIGNEEAKEETIATMVSINTRKGTIVDTLLSFIGIYGNNAQSYHHQR